MLVTFGAPQGLRASERHLALAQGDGLRGQAKRGDRLGTAVALADINCDGYADLAAGAPGRDLGGKTNVGAVVVRSGSSAGLDGSSWVLRPGQGLAGRKQDRAKVGSGVVAADVDDDGCADLVVSAPGTRVRQRSGAGAVHIAFGTTEASAGRDPMRIDQRNRVPGRPTTRGLFGGASPTELFKAALDA